LLGAFDEGQVDSLVGLPLRLCRRVVRKDLDDLFTVEGPIDFWRSWRRLFWHVISWMEKTRPRAVIDAQRKGAWFLGLLASLCWSKATKRMVTNADAE